MQQEPEIWKKFAAYPLIEDGKVIDISKTIYLNPTETECKQSPRPELQLDKLNPDNCCQKHVLKTTDKCETTNAPSVHDLVTELETDGEVLITRSSPTKLTSSCYPSIAKLEPGSYKILPNNGECETTIQGTDVVLKGVLSAMKYSSAGWTHVATNLIEHLSALGRRQNPDDTPDDEDSEGWTPKAIYLLLGLLCTMTILFSSVGATAFLLWKRYRHTNRQETATNAAPQTNTVNVEHVALKPILKTNRRSRTPSYTSSSSSSDTD